MDLTNLIYILCFDPGVVTGFISYDVINHKIIDHDCLKSYDEIYQKFNQFKDFDFCTNCIKNGTIVIYEKNVGKLITQDQFNMCKKVGFIEGLCESLNLKSFAQVPTLRLGYLKIAKEYFKSNKTSYEIHEIDAYAHILRFLTVNKI
jgi:hypothetical protein